MQPTEPPGTLTWHCHSLNHRSHTLTISGPRGTVQCAEIVWVTGRQDYIEDCYWAMVNTLDGVFHCCYTDRALWV